MMTIISEGIGVQMMRMCRLFIAEENDQERGRKKNN